MEVIMKIQKKCPKCQSDNLSSGTNDFLYDSETGTEVPMQFCNKCHFEWYIDKASDKEVDSNPKEKNK